MSGGRADRRLGQTIQGAVGILSPLLGALLLDRLLLHRIMANAATPLGMAIAGPLVDAIGVRPLYIVVGVLYILVGVGAFSVPPIARFGGNPNL